MSTRTVNLPKGVSVPVIFNQDGWDQDATMSAIFKVVEKYTLELEQDQEVVKGYVGEIRLAHGKDGVMVSTMPRGLLEMELHTKLGSNTPGADPDLYKRNDAKIQGALADLVVGAGKSGARFATPTEIDAIRRIRAAKKVVRAERKAAEKVAFDAFKATQAK